MIVEFVISISYSHALEFSIIVVTFVVALFALNPVSSLCVCVCFFLGAMLRHEVDETTESSTKHHDPGFARRIGIEMNNRTGNQWIRCEYRHIIGTRTLHAFTKPKYQPQRTNSYQLLE